MNQTLDNLLPGHDMVRVKELGVPVPRPKRLCWSAGTDPKTQVTFHCGRPEGHTGRHAAVGTERIALRVWS